MYLLLHPEACSLVIWSDLHAGMLGVSVQGKTWCCELTCQQQGTHCKHNHVVALIGGWCQSCICTPMRCHCAVVKARRVPSWPQADLNGWIVCNSDCSPFGKACHLNITCDEHILSWETMVFSVFFCFLYKGVASVAYLWMPCHLISSDGFSVQEQLIDGTFSESEFFS